jgi:hypothetical protein
MPTSRAVALEVLAGGDGSSSCLDPVAGCLPIHPILIRAARLSRVAKGVGRGFGSIESVSTLMTLCRDGVSYSTDKLWSQMESVRRLISFRAKPYQLVVWVRIGVVSPPDVWTGVGGNPLRRIRNKLPGSHIVHMESNERRDRDSNASFQSL